RPLLADQVLSRGDEVVEDVLLVRLGAGLVPVLAVLAAAAQVCHRVDTAQLQPADQPDRKARSLRDVKAAIPVEQRRVITAELHPLARGDEHRPLRAVLALIEALPPLVVVWVELHLGLPPRLSLARDEVVAVDARRRGVAGEAVKRLGVGALS